MRLAGRVAPRCHPPLLASHFMLAAQSAFPEHRAESMDIFAFLWVCVSCYDEGAADARAKFVVIILSRRCKDVD